MSERLLIGLRAAHIPAEIVRSNDHIVTMLFAQYASSWPEIDDRLISFSRNEVLNQSWIDKLQLGGNYFMQGPHQTGLTSLVEVEGNLLMQLPILYLKTPPGIPSQQYAKIREYIDFLAGASGWIISEGLNSYYFCGRDLLSMEDWLDIIRKARRGGQEVSVTERYLDLALAPKGISPSSNISKIFRSPSPLYTTLRMTYNYDIPRLPRIVDFIE